MVLICLENSKQAEILRKYDLTKMGLVTLYVTSKVMKYNNIVKQLSNIIVTVSGTIRVTVQNTLQISQM
jgi:hypothetical protein